MDAYKLRWGSENTGKIKKGTATRMEACRKLAGTNGCNYFLTLVSDLDAQKKMMQYSGFPQPEMHFCQR